MGAGGPATASVRSISYASKSTPKLGASLEKAHRMPGEAKSIRYKTSDVETQQHVRPAAPGDW